MIDTGADKSVISQEFLDSLDKKDIVKFEKCSSLVCGVSGHRLEMAGVVTLKFKIGRTNICHKFFVICDIVRPLILGSDLLMGRKDLKFKIDCENQTLSVGHSTVLLKNKGSVDTCNLVQVDQKTVIKPYTVNYISSKIIGKPKYKECVINPIDSESILFEQPGLMLANLIAKVDKKRKVPMVLVNHTDRTIVLKRGQTLGKAESLETSTICSIDDLSREEVDRLKKEKPDKDMKETTDPLKGIKLDHLTKEQREKIEALLLKFEKPLFAKNTKDLGHTNVVQLQIDTGDAKPIKQKPYRTPFSQRPIVEAEVKDMLEADVIRPSSSPWASPIVIVTKKDGTNRFCVDFRKVNNVLKQNSYPLPNIDDMLLRLGKAKYFTCLDLKSGYWQIEIREEDKEKTAFICHEGLFEFNKMPFGLASAPSVFSALMDKVLAGATKYAMCYIDDIIVFSETFEEHMAHLEDVLNRLEKAGLKIKVSKCDFLMPKVKYLGHVISAEGISPDPDKTHVIENLNIPTTVKGVRSIIGMASYYRRFIKNFAQIAKPLTQLTKKNQPFIWTDQCTRAFETLKTCLTQAPILAYPDTSQAYCLYTDASNGAVGAVLAQDHDGQECVIQYLSHQLNACQQKWPTIEQEAYAIVYAVNKLRHLLYGSKFVIHCDHKPLKTLFTSEMKNARVQRWAISLSEYGGDIEYQTGKTQKADMLSRVKFNPENGTFDINSIKMVRKPDILEPLINMIEVDMVDSDEPQEIGAPEFLDDNEEIVLDKGETLLKTGMPPISTLQQGDESLKEIFQGIERKEKKYNDFALYNGILYHIANPVKYDPETRLQLVIPTDLREGTLIEMHDNFSHMGIDKTHHLLRSKYYWPGMYKDVVQHLDECDKCRVRKIREQRAPMQEAYIPQYPFECVGIDTVGPLPESEYGNCQIIVMVDLFSGWPEAFAVSNKDAETVAQLLFEEIIARHGCPRSITSDNGKEYCNNLVEKLTKNLNIHHIRTSPYHPQANGKTERFNRFLKDAMSKRIQENQRDWDSHLSAILMAYRMAVHDSTGFSPFFLVYGRDPVLPLDTLLGPKIKYLGEEYVPTQLQRLNKAYAMARENLHHVRADNKARYDERASQHKFSVGDAVYYKNHIIKKGHSTSLSPKWRPYYRIVGQTGPVSYIIRNQLTGKTGKAHANDLYLANLDQPWDKARLEHRPVDKTEDPDLLDLLLQPVRTQPMRTCKLAVRPDLTTDKTVVKTIHNEKIDDAQPSTTEPQDHGRVTRSSSLLERKRRLSLSPTRADNFKRPRVDETMEIDELHVPDKMTVTQIYNLMKTCIEEIGSIVDLLHHM